MTPALFHIEPFLSEIRRKETKKYFVQALPCFMNDSSSTEYKLRSIEDLMVADNTNRTGTPNGARVPSWILNELYKRKHAPNDYCHSYKQQHKIIDHADIDAKLIERHESNPNFLNNECLYSSLGKITNIRSEGNTRYGYKEDESEENKIE